MTDHLEAAIQAGAETTCSRLSGGDAVFADQSPRTQRMFLDESRAALTAALPHLRLAIIQELANEAEAESDTDPMDITGAFSALPWICAKLKEADRG